MTAVSNVITLKRAVARSNAQAILAKNSSAKVFRQIVISIEADKVALHFGDVTEVAANGGYCNGAASEAEYTLTHDEFFGSDLVSHISDEPWAAVDLVLKLRGELTTTVNTELLKELLALA